jgi:beta-galactosidase
MVFSWPNWWAVESPASPAHDFRMQDQLTWMYRPLYRRSVTLDFASPAEPFGQYEALLVPSLYLVTEDEAANIRSYVEQGGTAIISFWSGIVDEHDRVYLGPYGGPLRSLIGCDVLDVAPLAPGDVVEVEWEDGTKTAASFWLDIAAERPHAPHAPHAPDGPDGPDGPEQPEAKVLARVTSGPWAGTPTVVQSRYGRGCVYYLGTRLDAEGLQRVYDLVPALQPGLTDTDAGIADDLERVVRRSADNDYEFVINHTDTDRKVLLAAPGYDVLGERPADGTLALGRRGVAIVRHG